MSSEKGNTKRTRAQKYQNTRAFKNDLYDKTPRTKYLNTLDITDVCVHCKGILEWRIKFKKYKLPKIPRTCVKCDQKNVFLAYRTLCADCAHDLKVCPKCAKTESEILPANLSPKNLLDSKSENEECEEDEDNTTES